MTPQQIHERVRECFGEDISDFHAEVKAVWFGVSAPAWQRVAPFLKTDKNLLFDALRSVAGVDYPDRLTAVYHLYSYTHRHAVAIKIDVPRDNPRLPSAEPVWKHADWMEREAYDLFGFIFEGHSDLRRVLLPEDWVGHPLRKDYQEPEEYRGIITWRENLLGRDVE